MGKKLNEMIRIGADHPFMVEWDYGKYHQRCRPSDRRIASILLTHLCCIGAKNIIFKEDA